VTANIIMSQQHVTRPRFGRIPAAMRYSGRGRTRLYEWANEYPGLFRKDGASTIVDFDVLDRILDGLPVTVPGPGAGVAAEKAPTHKPYETGSDSS
jgi:hypothetical protein